MDAKIIRKVVDDLCAESSLSEISFRTNFNTPMPSLKELSEVVGLLRAAILPGYFGSADHESDNQHFYVGTVVEKISKKLKQEVLRGYCFFCETQDQCESCSHKSSGVVESFMQTLPNIRHLLATDAVSAYEGDPAARSAGEAVFCYPSIKALVNHRIAHELYKLGVPLIPRIISELAHSETGIDIHPGAEIGERFFMDHGTGIVIGETSIIGKNVRLYQGVTLGAKSFPLDKDGRPIKGIARHPIVEDDVIIYAGATILGRITIGKGAVVGGNKWVTEAVPAGTKVV
jgi:serine O-acetyltransferase